MPKRSPKRKRQTARTRATSSIPQELLIDVIDELDFVEGMLGCVPQLQLVIQRLEENDTDDLARDPIGSWLKRLHAKQPELSIDDLEDHHESQNMLREAPSAAVKAAGWRLARVRTVLESVQGI